MTQSARELFGGVALTLAALGAVWLLPTPRARRAPAPAAQERHARPLSITPARPIAESAPPSLDALSAPVPEDIPDPEDPADADPAEARPAEPKPLAAEAPAAVATAAQPAPSPAAPGVVPEPPDELPPSHEGVRPPPRQVNLVQLQLWSEPGMCGGGEGAAARASLSANFQLWDGGDRGQFRVDPRLPLDSIHPILGYLDEAERIVAAHLKLRVPRPETFLYFDQRLLRAAACINSEVVAYYDGALHVVPGDADVRTSVIHEYTHHALFSSGLIGPAWAQEGMAMNLAQETWWMDRRWLTALLDHPFGMDDLDERVPYKLVPEQALLFYAQSAALVACVLERHRWEPDALFAALRNAANGDTLSYELPEVEYPSFLRGCLERWNK